MPKYRTHTLQDIDLLEMEARRREGGGFFSNGRGASTDYGTSQTDKSTKSRTIHSDENPEIVFEPISPHPYDLTYACLLIPRFSNHSLKGDLVEYIYGWMYQVCLSFNWLLDSIDVQPEYLQWLLSVPVAVPPAHFMRVIRQHLSGQIFAEFPKFKKENLSTDFWAPGHLVIVGKRLHSPEMIREFIRLTRMQQGTFPDRRD